MTDTGPPTELGDIVVTGQRRRPDGTFPSAGPSGGGGAGDPGGVNQDELSPDDPQPEPEPNPCAHPDSALEWNADAAAAEALRRMLDFARREFDEDHLANREFGTMLCEMNGSIIIGDIIPGDPLIGPDGSPTGNTPTVHIDRGSCPIGSTAIGMIHSHVSGSGAPSIADASWVPSINHDRPSSDGRIYIVSFDGTAYRIHVYDSSNAQSAAETGDLGEEVNPDGQPCSPGSVI